MLGKDIMGVCAMIERGEVEKASTFDNIDVKYQMTLGHVRPVDKYEVKVRGTQDVFHVNDATRSILF